MTFKPGDRRKRSSLIEWSDPSRQAHILDWHHRAHEFGLAVEEHEDERQPFELEPRRVLADEEPEAFAPQPIPDSDEDVEVEEQEQDEEEPAAGAQAGREEVDLVRVYLQHIGRRRLE